MQIDLRSPKGAVFSEDRRFRYVLWRVWTRRFPTLMCIGLNPSTANEVGDDPTITRLIARAAQSGFGSLLMGNLYSLVSTDPKALPSAIFSGDEDWGLNDNYLKKMVKLSGTQLCGWGSFKPVWIRHDSVFQMLRNPVCLGINKDGQPKHPLYVAYGMPMVKYEGIR